MFLDTFLTENGSEDLTVLPNGLALLSTVRPYQSYSIEINHGFQCSNIQWITRKAFEHKAAH